MLKPFGTFLCLPILWFDQSLRTFLGVPAVSHLMTAARNNNRFNPGLLPLGVILWVALLCACTSVQPLDADRVAQHTGFIHAGETPVEEIEARLGTQFSSYEEGRIRVYQVFFDGQERLTLKALPGATCHALVLVFDNGGVLQRSGLVKNGCRENAP